MVGVLKRSAKSLLCFVEKLLSRAVVIKNIRDFLCGIAPVPDMSYRLFWKRTWGVSLLTACTSTLSSLITPRSFQNIIASERLSPDMPSLFAHGFRIKAVRFVAQKIYNKLQRSRIRKPYVIVSNVAGKAEKSFFIVNINLVSHL